MLHQFIPSYNILTVIFHFSHLSICFPTWYQQSNGGRRKKMLHLHTISKTICQRVWCVWSKQRLQAGILGQTILLRVYIMMRTSDSLVFFTNLGYSKLFVLQFRLYRCNFTQWGMFPVNRRSPRCRHLAICRLASSCPLLQSASPLCSMLLVSTGAQNICTRSPRFARSGVKTEARWQHQGCGVEKYRGHRQTFFQLMLMWQFSNAKWPTMSNRVFRRATNSGDDLCFFYI